MRRSFKVGEKYTIQFWDHCLEEDKILCEVTLWVTKEDKTFVYGTWWRVLTEDTELEESNREMLSIVKSAIKRKRKQIKL
jgi:hypothetical protein